MAQGIDSKLAQLPGFEEFDVVSRYAAKLTEAQTELAKALANLSERDRQLVVLRDIESRSYEEIAERLGLRLGTVKSGLSRARQRFAQNFAAVG